VDPSVPSLPAPRPGVTAPIASAASLEQLQDLIAATRLRLDTATVERLDRASA
jgi:aryl-alcohol dehydrogenase-like predicted oxidoreductase